MQDVSNNGTDDLDRMLEVARAAARAAGDKALQFFADRGALAVEHKGVQDLVTRADREVEELLKARLSADAPGTSVLGEEAGGALDDSEGLWVVDPIDGTSNFVHGIPFWCVSIALVTRGIVTVGVVYDPVHDEMFSARRGGGAFVGAERIVPSAIAEENQALVAYGESGRTSKSVVADALRSLKARDVDLRKLGSAALAAAWVAAGRVDGFFELHLNAWDALGALVIIQEAGGVTNDFLDDDGLAQGSAFVAANAQLYPKLSGLLSPQLSPSQVRS